MRDLTISTAMRRFSSDWMPHTVSWDDLVSQLQKVNRTGETVAEYKAMPKDAKHKAKDHGGFVGGYVQGARTASAVKFRSVVTLDLDDAKPNTLDGIRATVDGYAWCVYSTHSHTPEKPKYRLVVPLDRDVAPDEYNPIARRLAEFIGIEAVDQVSFSPHQLMYWPTCPQDGDFVFETGEGGPLEADEMLATYRDWRDFTEYPRTPNERQLRASAEKMGDPRTKPGEIGAFCRRYPISAAIETFLSEVYEPTTTEGRYTYKGGTTAGGLIVYDDLYAYSHHATDPISGREVNAFDLVRLHKYGSDDELVPEDTAVTQLPSYKQMVEFCNELPDVKVEMVNSISRKTAEQAFGADIPDIEDEEEEDESWKADLRLVKNSIVCDAFNCDLICKHDPALKDTVRYDEFANRAEVTRDLPWRKIHPGDVWSDNDDKGLLWYVSMAYKISGKTTILDAHDLTIQQSSYHPVRDYLNGLKWDGKKRLDRMLIDYLNADDTPLVEAMTHVHMVAAVARVMRPGCKYDYALTLSGPEGIGKTTIIRKLGMKWYSNSFSSGDIGDKTSMEQVQGQWLIELGELVAVRKSTNEAFKNFITTEKDKFRPAYARKTSEFPRQCVFWATTNERYFLKGDTGNRRFLTVYVHGWGDDLPVKDVFDMGQDEVDQLWAEAVYYYKRGDKLYLDHGLEMESRRLSEEANEITGDERIGEIEAFIRRPIPADWYKRDKLQRAEWFRFGHSGEFVPDGEENRRKYICSREIANELYQRDMSRYEMREVNQMLIRIKGLRQAGPTNTADRAYGCQRRYEILPEFWATKKDVANDDLE